jgi:2-oxoglutarate dehydrogenase E1 component
MLKQWLKDVSAYQIALNKYTNAKFCWVQEEPSNMGAWQYVLAFNRNFNLDLIARKSSASPATGYKKLHATQTEEILSKAFATVEEKVK